MNDLIGGSNSEVKEKDGDDEIIQELKKLHKSIATIYTFLVSSGRYIITTFETLKPAVERDISRPLKFEDLAILKLLLFDDIVFEYVDENQVEQHAHPIVNFSRERGYEPSERDIYNLENCSDDKIPKKLLIFEFVDGNVKPEKKKRKIGTSESGGGAIPGFMSSSSKTVITRPSFSVDKIKQMINKRMMKFDLALKNFRELCAMEGVPLSEALEVRSKPFIPQIKEFVDPVEFMTLRSINSNNNTHEDERDDRSNGNSVIRKFIRDIKKSPDYVGQIVENGEIQVPEKHAEYGGDSSLLSVNIANALMVTRGITKLYSHQFEALDSLQSGSTNNIIVTTSTSSGKSLIYQLPVLQALENDRYATAMYIFPTKALAQDQKRSFQELLFAVPGLQHIVAETYDGDTPKDKRYNIRETASVIFTNPDMIHSSILPSWDLWRPYLRNLRCLVVDELHVYNGLFGAHVSFIMRRLMRILTELGNTNVQIISCSATIRNPKALMSSVFGIDGGDNSENLKVIKKDGSPIGSRSYLLWNSRYVSPKDINSGRVHPVSEAAHLLIDLVSRGIRTIAFCKVRRTCELLMKSIRTRLEKDFINGDNLLSKVMAYRGGYSLEDRRRIEKEMFDGHLLGIVATNALELGIDIGNLDAVLIVGFPFTVSNLRQQCGRVGRRNRESLAIIIGSGDPVDQYYMTNPMAIFEAPDADVALALDNVLVQESHLQCAAYELPIKLDTDGKYFGFDMSKPTDKIIWEDLVKTRLLSLEIGDDSDAESSSSFYTCHHRFLPSPSNHVTIRGIDDEEYAVVDTTNGRNVVIETVEASRTYFTLYEGGIFLHQGQPYLIQEFNSQEQYAKVTRVDVDWITRQRDFTNVDPIETELFYVLKRVGDEGRSDADNSEARDRDGEDNRKFAACFGRIEHCSIVFGFFKIDKRDRILDAVEVDNPPIIFESKGFWIDVPNEALRILKDKKLSLPGAIHGAEHAVLSLFPNFVSTLPGDVSTECKAPEKEYANRQTTRKRPARLIFCDRRGGQQGTGISRKAFEFVDDLLQQAIDRIEHCPCELGCPECVASTSCREYSEIISKVGALIIFKVLTGTPIYMEEIPEGPERNLKKASTVETVVPASPVRLSKRVNKKD